MWGSSLSPSSFTALSTAPIFSKTATGRVIYHPGPIDTRYTHTTFTVMNTTLQPSEWFPSVLTPFVTLSYPTERPANVDSFYNSSYYGVGLLDLCFIVTCIAVMAILRDFLRLAVCQPFARWYLRRQLQISKSKQNQNGHADGNGTVKGAAFKVNGVENGNAKSNGHAVHADGLVISKAEARQLRHSVIRFSEQGWSAVYYLVQFCYGLVSGRISSSCLHDPEIPI